MQAFHPLWNCFSHTSSVFTRAGTKKKSEQFVGNQANIPWETSYKPQPMDCFYSVSCHKRHFLGE